MWNNGDAIDLLESITSYIYIGENIGSNFCAMSSSLIAFLPLLPFMEPYIWVCLVHLM